MNKKSVVFITNPFSGTSSKNNLNVLIDENLDKNKFDYQIWKTEYSGHAKLLAQKACDKKIDVVASVGGDGTLNEIASVLVNKNILLAVVPGGSGNGFSYHIGIKRDVKSAIEAINQGKTIKIDTCTANEHFFINVAGLGLDAKVSYETKRSTKRGFLLYFTQTLKEAKNFKYLKLKIDFNNNFKEGEYAMAVVANGSIYGYNFAIAPTAVLDDGEMDILLIKKAPIFRYFLLAFRMINKSFHKSPLVEFYRTKHIKITVTDLHYLHTDGEGFQNQGMLDFNIVPKSLNLIIPKQ